MGTHRAARPIKRNALIAASVIALAMGVSTYGEDVSEVPWAGAGTAAVSSPGGSAVAFDPEVAALELAQSGQQGGPAASEKDPDKAKTAAATPATVAAAAPVEPPSPGLITGLVRAPSGAPLDNVVVEAVAVEGARTPRGDELTRAPVAATVLSGDARDQASRGTYALEVPAGRYVVRYRPAPGSTAWKADYNGRASAGRPVMVTPGAERTLPDQTMARAQTVTIRGLVWDESSAMVPGVVVQLIRRSGGTMVPVDFAMTDEVGAFEFPMAARSADYTVRVRGGSDVEGTVLPVAHGWLGDTTDPSRARWVGTGEGAEKVTLGPIRVFEQIESVAAPAIEGDVRVGQVLRVGAGAWNVEPDAQQQPGLVYQWLRDGEEIPNAVGPTYTVRDGDLDSMLSARVRASLEGETATAYATPALVRRAAPPASVTAPSILGEPVVGTTLRADLGEWSSGRGAPVRTMVAWQRDGLWIPGSEGRTYRIRPDDVGHEIAAVVAAWAGRSDATRVATKRLRVANLVSTTTAERTQAGMAVEVELEGDATASGRVLLLDRGEVLAERPLRAGDQGRVVFRGAGDASSVLFLGDPGIADSQADLD